VDRSAVRVGEHLDLNVPRRRDEPLDVERAVSEGGPGFVARPGDRGREFHVLSHGPHALSAAAGGGLDDQREAAAPPPDRRSD
jgi:hypothetical protein